MLCYVLFSMLGIEPVPKACLVVQYCCIEMFVNDALKIMNPPKLTRKLRLIGGNIYLLLVKT